MGPMMTTLVDQFANMDGEGYGVRLEMAPVHPGLGATSLPWAGGREWKRSLARFRCVGGRWRCSAFVSLRECAFRFASQRDASQS